MSIAVPLYGFGGVSYSAVQKAAPRNLLDNSNFTNLIAQAGIGGNHGDTAYAADRWILESGTVSYEEGVGLTLDGTILQKLEFPPARATSAFVGMESGEASIAYADGKVTITSHGGVIKWAALYLGEYTVGTMPEYHPIGYSAELLECMRYFTKCYSNIVHCLPGGALRLEYHSAVKARIDPTCLIDKASIYDNSVTEKNVSFLWNNYNGDGHFLLSFSSDGLSVTPGYSYIAIVEFTMCADL